MKEREGGYIKTHRRLYSSPLYLSLTGEQRSVFHSLLCLANWKDNPVMLFGEWHTIKRGELFHSLSTIAKHANVSVKTVRSALVKLLADDTEIGGRGPFLRERTISSKTGKDTGKAPRVLTIVNYCEYQDVDGEAGKDPGKARAKEGQSEGKGRAPIEEGKEVEAVEEKTSSAAGASAKADKSKNHRHATTIALWVRLWKELRGGDYRVAGGKDASAVKRLLTYPEATDAEIERRARRSLADQWFRQNGDLALFVSQWSKWEPPSALPLFAQVAVNDGFLEAEDDFYGRQAAEADARHAKEAANHGN